MSDDQKLFRRLGIHPLGHESVAGDEAWPVAAGVQETSALYHDAMKKPAPAAPKSAACGSGGGCG